jgi:ribosomal protein L29
MKKKDLRDLRDKDVGKLRDLLSEKKVDLTKTLAELKAGKEKNFKKASNMRDDIAQIMTIIREKVIIQEAGSKKGEGK